MRYRIAAMIFSILKWIGYRGTLSMDNRVLNILSTEKLDIGEATEPNSVLHIQSSGNVGSIEQTPGNSAFVKKGILVRGMTLL